MLHQALQRTSPPFSSQPTVNFSLIFLLHLTTDQSNTSSTSAWTQSTTAITQSRTVSPSLSSINLTLPFFSTVVFIFSSHFFSLTRTKPPKYYVWYSFSLISDFVVIVVVFWWILVVMEQWGRFFSSSQSGFWVVGGGLCFSLVVAMAGPGGGWGLTCVSLFWK